MNKFIYWSVTVAVTGFLFGFDTTVISGADQPIQALWGTAIGALAGNYPCEK